MLLDLTTVKHHPVLTELVDVLCNKTKNNDRGFFQAEVAYFLAKMASSMRATIVTEHQGEMPVNVYAMALAHSGYGKGHSIFVMEEEIMKGFHDRFLADTFPVLSEQGIWIIANDRAARNGTDQQTEFDSAKREFEDQGEYDLEFDSATAPAVKGQLRKKLLMANIGSMNLQMDEIGLNLSGNTEVLTVFLELYDQGMIKQKLIKNSAENKRGSRLSGKTPANMLLFGTPEMLFDGSQTEDLFYALLKTGMARRCIFGYGQHNAAYDHLTAEEVYDQLIQPAHLAAVAKWYQRFYTLADPALAGWKMTVPRNVSVTLIAYQKQCKHLADQLPEYEDIKKAEIMHRHTKSLKLAGAYAFVDQSTEILEEHLYAAIKLVEESGDAFQTTLNREKTYEKLAKFIAGTQLEITHADIHDKLPFYPKSSTPRNDMMMLATAWGYRNNVIIKKSFVDGIEFFNGEMLEKTDLDNIVVSYSDNWAYHFLGETVGFDQLHILTQAKGMHWANHHFKDGHRCEENVISGFNMVAIDVDTGVSLQTAQALMGDYKFLTYTTKRHTEEENRFRMLLPINYRLKLNNDDYKEFMRSIFAWLPFKCDESYDKREKKSESFSEGNFHYNLDGQILDVLSFIPRTSRFEQAQQQNQQLGSLDNLERWFLQRIGGEGSGRNKQMIKYALCLVDSGWDLPSVQAQVHAFNKKLSNPLDAREIDSTILVTVAKKYQITP
jgi:hypothetical protein